MADVAIAAGGCEDVIGGVDQSLDGAGWWRVSGEPDRAELHGECGIARSDVDLIFLDEQIFRRLARECSKGVKDGKELDRKRRLRDKQMETV